MSRSKPGTPWPILVLSLPDSTERRAAVTAQMDALGIPFTFLDAVDGRKGLAPEYEAMVDRPGTIANLGYPMGTSEYACALSHQVAYKRILDEGWPGAIIFEDDVILTDNFRQFYGARGYEAAPMIQFFYFDAVVWKPGSISTPTARLERLWESAFMAVGYSISAEGAAKMREASLPLIGKPDWPCDTARIVGHYITEPRIVLHPDPLESESILDGTRTGLVPEGFDYSAGYAKGWARLVSLASWKRLLTRPLRKRRWPGYGPTPEEEASRRKVEKLMSRPRAAAQKSTAKKPAAKKAPAKKPAPRKRSAKR